MGTRLSSRALPVVLWVLPSVVVLGLLAYSYLPFISDDALISLRYAERLLDGQGLTWTDGERVEGYSNLLWTLLCAGLGLFGVDLIVAARVLGVLATIGALVAVVYAHRPRTSHSDPLPALGGSLALALTGPLVVWSVGGLEQALQAGLLAWALVSCYPLLDSADRSNNGLLPGLLLALLCWTRPDAPLFTVGIVGGLLAARGIDSASIKLAFRLAALAFLAYAAQLIFRLVYYDAWVPNSALAKVAFTADRLGAGLTYVGWGWLWLIGLALPALALGWLAHVDRESRARVRFLITPLLLWCIYVAVIGGDSFPARRYFVPLVVMLALLLGTGLAAALRRNAAGRSVLWGGTVLALIALGVMQHYDPQNRRAHLERWEWDGEVIGNLLRQAFPERPLLAVDPAGTLPYFSKLPAVDMLGINDRYLARHRPDDFGRGHLGHELGDGNYVLEREPDLVVFCGPAGGVRPCFRSGKEMVGDPRFRQHYRPVIFEGDDPYAFRSQIWVRAEKGKIGIQRVAGRVTVPAFLLMDTGDSVARLDSDNRLYVALDPATPAGIAALALPQGAWRMRVVADGAPVSAALRRTGTETTLAVGGGELEFVVDREGTAFDVIVRTGEGAARLFALELEQR